MAMVAESDTIEGDEEARLLRVRAEAIAIRFENAENRGGMEDPNDVNNNPGNNHVLVEANLIMAPPKSPDESDENLDDVEDQSDEVGESDDGNQQDKEGGYFYESDDISMQEGSISDCSSTRERSDRNENFEHTYERPSAYVEEQQNCNFLNQIQEEISRLFEQQQQLKLCNVLLDTLFKLNNANSLDTGQDENGKCHREENQNDFVLKSLAAIQEFVKSQQKDLTKKANVSSVASANSSSESVRSGEASLLDEVSGRNEEELRKLALELSVVEQLIDVRKGRAMNDSVLTDYNTITSAIVKALNNQEEQQNEQNASAKYTNSDCLSFSQQLQHPMILNANILQNQLDPQQVTILNAILGLARQQKEHQQGELSTDQLHFFDILTAASSLLDPRWVQAQVNMQYFGRSDQVTNSSPLNSPSFTSHPHHKRHHEDERGAGGPRHALDH